MANEQNLCSCASSSPPIPSYASSSSPIPSYASSSPPIPTVFLFQSGLLFLAINTEISTLMHKLEYLAIDFVDLPPTFWNGFRYDSALIGICRHSDFVLAITMEKENRTTEYVSKMIHDSWFCLIGVPKEISSDHDIILDAKFFTSLCSLSGVKHIMVMAYRSQSHGKAENAVGMTVRSLRKILLEISKSINNWAEALPRTI